MNASDILDPNKISPIVDLFRNNGPYLVAVLFLLVALSLLRSREQIPRMICVASFAISILAFIFGSVLYYYITPLVVDNVKYVLLYKIQNADKLVPMLDRVAVLNDLDQVAKAYASPEFGKELNLIVVRQKPLLDENVQVLYIHLNNNNIPLIFCPAKLKNVQQVQVVLTNPNANAPNAGDFSFQVMEGSRWKDWNCAS